MSSRRLWSRWPAVMLAAGLALANAGCDWLLGLDREPPFCFWRSPADSGYVSGTVLLQVDAIDSLGVSVVDFFVNGDLLGSDSLRPYSAAWDTGPLPDRSWHRLWAVATDLSGNRGFSDSVSVQVLKGGQRSVYHGTITIANGRYSATRFDARAGDTLVGEFRVQSGNLTRFAWLDGENFDRFQNGQPHSAIAEAVAVSEYSVLRPTSAGRQYIVFVNSEGSERVVWARFTLE